jgi:hypothetical protein
MATMTAPEAPQATKNSLAQFRRLIRANTARWKTIILLEAVGIAVAAPLAYMWFVFLLDNGLHLPMLGRLVAALGLFGGVGWAATHLVRRWRSIHLTEDQVALAIERCTPGGVENRLINAVQLSRGDHGNDPLLSEAVVQENCEKLKKVHLEQAAQMRPAAVRLGVAGFLVLVGLVFLIVSPAHFGNAAVRILLPFADIDPLYRTTLRVEPGDVDAVNGEAPIQITIKGERPKNLVLLKNIDGKRSTETIPVDADDDGPITHVIRDVHQNMTYAVRGNDYTTRTYRVKVPMNASLARVRVTYRYPSYTGLEPRNAETRGDLEGLQGTRAQVTFVFDQPVDSAVLVLESSAKKAGEPQPLTQVSEKEFEGEIVLDNVVAYRLDTVQGERANPRSGAYPIRILKHPEPKLELTGIERRSEVQIDAVLTLAMSASDEYGLEQVGLFYRTQKNGSAGASPSQVASPSQDDGWRPIEVWPVDKKKAFQKKDYSLAVASLQVAEGDRIELALRAVNTDPLRKNEWTTGVIHELSIGGDGVALQVQYEQIVQSERELKKLLAAEQESLNAAIVWLRKLEGAGDIRWDDPKNVDALHAAVKELVKDQDKIHKTAGQVVKGMIPQTGNLRLGLAMLADSEMVRLQRIYDAVPSREKPGDKRAALADARVTQERIVRSLEEMIEQHAAFRSDWELSNMVPFTKMLADRQTKMRDQSKKLSPLPTKGEGSGVRGSMHRRQSKVLDLVHLIQPAFTGLATRLEEQEPGLSKAFADGAKTLASDNLLKPLAQAAEDAKAGRWNDAVQNQTQAAEQLTALHDQLRQAQLDAAAKALAALKEKLKSDLAAQKEIEKLTPGSAEAFLKDYADKLTNEEKMRLEKIAGAKKRTDKNPFEEPDLKDAFQPDVDRKKIELKEDSGVRQDPYSLKLGTIAEKTPILKMYKADKENVVKPFVQEQFDDLVGKLLDETEELSKNYQSIKLSTNQNNNDPGEISKVGGALNSTGAVTATGNKKPPTMESGGLSRTGRQGARAYGMVADDEGVDRRGRDKALDGKEEVADQKGTLKMKKSDDPQKDTATGVGGKRVESDDTNFSLHDAGKWKDDYAKRMEKPQKKNYLVDRQGDPIDAKTAALLRDLTSKQEQVIERLKSIKKDLRNLYLPTEHLDELAAQLESNLASLKEQPDAELFRQQMQTLDKLRGAMRVFQGVNSSFQPSLPRERAIRGRVLDEPGRQALPGYEEAVRQYYRKLAEQ